MFQVIASFDKQHCWVNPRHVVSILPDWQKGELINTRILFVSGEYLDCDHHPDDLARMVRHQDDSNMSLYRVKAVDNNLRTKWDWSSE